MTKADSHALLKKLKSSLPQPEPVKSPPLEPLPPPSAQTAIEAKSPKPKAKPANPAGQGSDSLSRKVSVSLYRTDLARLDEIKEFMRKEGYRNLSDSEAVQLACRAVKISHEFLDCYQEMHKEDGRRRIAAK